MMQSDRRIGHVYFPDKKDPEALSRTVEALRHALFSAIEEIAVMKALLEAKGLWDPQLYKELRIDTMLKDASTAGPFPWSYHSYYPHFLDHEDFLRDQFNATDEEVKQFALKREEGFLET